MHEMMLPPDAFLGEGERALEWVIPETGSELMVAVPHKTGHPTVRLQDDGMVCILRWGSSKKGRQVVLESRPSPSFLEALTDVCDMAVAIPESKTERWNELLGELLTLPCKYGAVQVKNIINIGPPLYQCSVAIGEMVVLSDGQPTARGAVEDVAKKLQAMPVSSQQIQAISSSGAPKPKSKNTQRTISKEEKTSIKKLAEEITEENQRRKNRNTLTALRHAWMREHGWLMQQKALEDEDAERARELSLFLAIMDPLRKYEIDGKQRALCFEAMEREMAVMVARLEQKDRWGRRKEYVKVLVGKHVPAAHAIIKINTRFIRLAYSLDESPDTVIAELVRWGYLEKVERGLVIGDEGLSLYASAVRATLNDTSLGASLSHDLLLELARLKTT